MTEILSIKNLGNILPHIFTKWVIILLRRLKGRQSQV